VNKLNELRMEGCEFVGVVIGEYIFKNLVKEEVLIICSKPQLKDTVEPYLV